MSTADELRAALAVAELEEQLVAAKDAGTLDDDLKHRLRDARRTYRELREHAPADVADGDAVVTPDPLIARTEVNL